MWFAVFTQLSLHEAPAVSRVCRRFRSLYWAARVRVSLAQFGGSDGQSVVLDSFVARVAQRSRNLQALELGDRACVSDLALGFLVSYTPRLRRLTLGSHANGLSDRGIARLAALSQLDSLALASVPALSNKGLAAIAALTRLSSLELGHVYLASDAGFAKLAALTNLVDLRLAHCPQLSDAAVAVLLAHLTGLRRIALVSCAWLSTSIARHLEPLTALHRIDIAHCARLAQWRDNWPLSLLPIVHDELGDRFAPPPSVAPTRPLTSASIQPPPPPPPPPRPLLHTQH